MTPAIHITMQHVQYLTDPIKTMILRRYFEGKCRTMQDIWLFAGHLYPKIQDNARQFWNKKEKCRTMQDTGYTQSIFTGKPFFQGICTLTYLTI